MTAAEDPRVGQVIADRYRVEARLGEGGMGVVYLAEHVHMRKRFAVKVLHREMTHDEQVVARFERESVAAARIEHPNVVAAKDFGRLKDGAFYLVLDYVTGESLRNVIKRGPLEPTRALGIARQIAAALTAAHAARIIHRDLKPDNVMLVQGSDGGELVKVLDFGIAKLALEETQGQNPLTQIGTVFGTPEYMSPEQAMGLPVDHRADLYGLGIVLYEMLAGHLPFQADEAVALITQHMVADPPPLPAHIDPTVASLVMALLAKSPDERPQTAAELGGHIDTLLARAVGPRSGARTPAPSPSAGTVVGYVSPTQFSVGQQPTSSDPGLARAVTQLPTSLPQPQAPVSQPTASVKAPLERTLEPLHLPQLLQLLTRSVRVRGKLVPVWLLGAAALLLATLVITTTAALLSRGSSDSAEDGEFKPKKPLAARASKGDAAAVAELESKPQDDLDLDELLALGAGRLRLGRTRAAIQAYKAAVEREGDVVKRQHVIHDVRRAADDPAASRDALELAATKFGAAGADILFDVMQDAEPESTIANQASDLLDSPNIRNVASEALRIALDLSQAKKCAEFKDLMGRAGQHADRRSLPYLEKLEKKTGCGRRRRHDCYRCLRGGSEIADAVMRARATAAPSVDGAIANATEPASAKEP